MLLSVVVSTYNQPVWLEKVCWGLARQTDREFEVLVADDGSGPDTGALIGRAATLIGAPVCHLWHEDRGFRKCVILNQAIRAARGDYLVFLDGDCIPRSDFLAVHRCLATPGRFLSGGAFRLPRAASERITRDVVLSMGVFRPTTLRDLGVPWSFRLARLGATPRLAALLDALTPTRATFNGGNASVWRRDVLAVNGFDERMAHGGLDREFGVRLENAGVRGVQVRHRAIVLHLDHDRAYRDPEAVRRNRAIWDETVATRRTRTATGLDAHDGNMVSGASSANPR